MWNEKVHEGFIISRSDFNKIDYGLHNIIVSLTGSFASIRKRNNHRKEILKVKLGIDFSKVKFTPEEYLEGLNIQLEHGLVVSETNVTSDDPIMTGKIALAHLNEVKPKKTCLKRELTK